MKLFILSALGMISISTRAQTLLLNEGGTITVQSGATLYVEGGIKNMSAGVIDNNGTIQLKGDLENLATWDPTGANTLVFLGDQSANVTSNGALFYNVVIQKGNNFNVTLLDAMNITNNLDFNAAGGANNRLVTGNFDLKLTSAATATGYEADEYVATTGTGVMQKSVTANGAFFFPIGDLTNYSPLSSTYTGASYTSATLKAKANDLTHPNKPTEAESFISRYWDIDGAGIGLPYSNTLIGTYIPADANGTAALIKGAVYSGAVWSYAGAAAGANTVTGTTTALLSDFTGTNFYGKVNLKALLQGPFNGVSAMSTDLNPTYIPTMTPYTDGASVGAVPAGVTDWVFLELRDATTPSIILGGSSAFIKSDGSIVGLDGTSLPTIENGNLSSIVAVHHRNHLPFRTNVGLNVTSPTLEDFTAVNAKLYDNGIDNPPLNLIATKYLMWSCDVGGTTFLLNSNDVLQVKQLTATPFTMYSRADVNLNSLGNSNDVLLTKQNTAVPKSADL